MPHQEWNKAQCHRLRDKGRRDETVSTRKNINESSRGGKCRHEAKDCVGSTKDVLRGSEKLNTEAQE